MSARRPLPRWADVALVPALNLLLALVVSAIVVIIIGKDPIEALNTMIFGAFGYGEGVGYTLHFATNFVFAGLAVAIAAHGGLFNIGAEGQAYVAGLGAILVALALDGLDFPGAWILSMLCAMAAAGAVGGIWAFIPGWLQAKRGSHVVITTIMFNFIASAFMIYMVNRLRPLNIQAPESASVKGAGAVPQLREFFDYFGYAPVNMTLLVAIAALVLVYVLVWHTKFGFALRTMGHNPTAARYAGMSNSRLIMLAMTISGALAGMIAINETLAVQHRLVLDYVAGYGFVGIAVALMGRNHPIGIALAAVLFGALYQGGQELQIAMGIKREMILVIQALVILFTGAMEGLLRPPLQSVFMIFGPRQKAEAVARSSAQPES